MKKEEQRSLEPLTENFVTVSQAAKLRGVSRAAIHALIDRGRLQPMELFGRLLVSRKELRDFEKQKPGPKVKEKAKGLNSRRVKKD